MKSIFYCMLFFSFLFANGQVAKASSGSLEEVTAFKSKFIDTRTVTIWLPEGYSEKEKYAVLYMHDGQMLFDSSITWNKQAWDVDDIAGEIQQKGLTQKFIIVGIWNNSSKRHSEYFPQKPFESLTPIEREFVSNELQKAGRTKATFQPISDLYLKFLVTELKPYIDSKYATYSDVQHTFIAGSSMGGLISMYAICEYPTVFGGAACLSTHWPGIFATANNPIPEAFIKYLRSHLPNPESHKIYFDYGDQTLDALYAPLQQNVDKVMEEKGFTTANWMTQFFPGKDHSENRGTKELLFHYFSC